MNRLQTELQRLYLQPEAEQGFTDAELTRTMVLELVGPAAWDSLGKVWRGVQADLQLPAPGIAVTGVDGYQLWFSLCEAVPAEQVAAFLASLRSRYLGDVAPERLRMTQPTAGLPPIEQAPGQWSAFIKPDLAPLFADEAWLDLAPSADAQADLLSRLQGIQPADFRRALQGLGPAARASKVARAAASPGPAAEFTKAQPAGSHEDPRRFLLDVMNDPAIELALRIEAAKALLPFFKG